MMNDPMREAAFHIHLFQFSLWKTGRAGFLERFALFWDAAIACLFAWIPLDVQSLVTSTALFLEVFLEAFTSGHAL